MIVDDLASGEGVAITKKGFSSCWGRSSLGEVELLWLLPQGFMNRSGEAVREAKDYYKISDRDLMVVHDDLDLPLGRLKLDFDAGPAGHRGVTSIQEALGTKGFYRLRVGIGRPATKEEVEQFVLSPFEKKDEGVVQEMVREASGLLKKWILSEGT